MDENTTSLVEVIPARRQESVTTNETQFEYLNEVFPLVAASLQEGGERVNIEPSFIISMFLFHYLIMILIKNNAGDSAASQQ